MKIDGHCHCGYLSFEADVDPDKVTICNCTDCQVLSGSAFRVVVPANEGSFKLLSGQPKHYLKTAESGNKRVQGFCPECGAHIYSAPPDGKPGYMGLRVGTLSQRDELIPKAQIWCRSAQGWTGHIADLPGIEKQ